MLKGIILAGGANTRLYPLTMPVCKQLLPVYDKPMIFYPLSTLLRIGCKEILIITRNERDQSAIMEMLPQALFGVKFRHVIQTSPRGLADALIMAKASPGFITPRDRIAMILGDNLFDGGGLGDILTSLASCNNPARVFFHRVRKPEQYGVGAFDGEKLVEIIEKPAVPPSRWAQTGLYFYDPTAMQIASDLKPSGRGELEITDLNNTYLRMGALAHTKLHAGICWFDMGTPDDLLGASHYVATIQQRQNTLVGCPAAAALAGGLTDESRVATWAGQFNNEYGDTLRRWLDEQVAVPSGA